MAKQSYSVALERDLMGMVDALAEQEGRSRSAVVGRLLERAFEKSSGVGEKELLRSSVLGIPTVRSASEITGVAPRCGKCNRSAQVVPVASGGWRCTRCNLGVE